MDSVRVFHGQVVRHGTGVRDLQRAADGHCDPLGLDDELAQLRSGRRGPRRARRAARGAGVALGLVDGPCAESDGHNGGHQSHAGKDEDEQRPPSRRMARPSNRFSSAARSSGGGVGAPFSAAAGAGAETEEDESCGVRRVPCGSSPAGERGAGPDQPSQVGRSWPAILLAGGVIVQRVACAGRAGSEAEIGHERRNPEGTRRSIRRAFGITDRYSAPGHCLGHPLQHLLRVGSPTPTG